MPHVFKGNATHTLGVEIELQLIDSKTGALANSIASILERVPPKWASSIKPEFMQSYCEINTDICNTVKEVESDLSEKLQWAQDVAEELGLCFVWAGTHPFSRWEHQKVTPGERYAWLLHEMQDVARRMLIFGLHVHVGVDSGDKAIHMCDRLLRHLPTLLAISANSPLWCGRDTGMQSYRSKVIEALPTAGLPQMMRNWSEYVWLVDHLIKTKFISSIREIWWDVRPHAGFGTVEMRIMDMPLNMRHTLGIVALTQSLVAAISDQIDRGAYLYDSHPMIAKQNRWQAGRHGMEAQLVDFDTMQAMPARTIARRLIELVAPYAQRLDCVHQLHFLDDIIENGTGAARQRKVYEQSGDPRQVVQFLIEQSQMASVGPIQSPSRGLSAPVH
ncbi:MAG: glutamate--cysteine ligase [Phycisphaerales bacterium]|nr:glutamate--cysteine ligase [Phycisphaerales bacterium]MCI0674875.1 glutamate--cysteine ligase [Phycisphaerales bacterium]